MFIGYWLLVIGWLFMGSVTKKYVDFIFCWLFIFLLILLICWLYIIHYLFVYLLHLNYLKPPKGVFLSKTKEKGAPSLSPKGEGESNIVYCILVFNLTNNH